MSETTLVWAVGGTTLRFAPTTFVGAGWYQPRCVFFGDHLQGRIEDHGYKCFTEVAHKLIEE